jgi:aryl-alcohol dehydrogenase-like predicted oxidoreductase
MIYKKLGNTDVELSIIGLGGHEFLPNGSSRGFNEDSKRAVTPGEIFDGFGGPKRQAVLASALENGINFFDATMDSEKEALGRNLQELQMPYEIYIQTRPEGMVYGYDPYNQRMANYDLLKAEVQRGLKLLKRDHLDFLNLGFLKSALEHDPNYLHKMVNNVQSLKREGLIRFACADTFSGESTYLEQIETGCFDAIFINFNVVDCKAEENVLPAANAGGLGVFAREAFVKGRWFEIGQQVGITARNHLAQVAIKWVLSHQEVNVVVVGIDNPEQLRSSLEVLRDITLNADDYAILQQIQTAPLYQEVYNQKSSSFMQ